MKAKRILAAVLIIAMLLSMSAFTFADNEIEQAEQNAVELEDSNIQDTLTAEVDTTSGGSDFPESEDPAEGMEPPLEAVEEAQSELDLEVDDVDAAETEESSDEAIAEISEFFAGFDGAASDTVYKDGIYTATGYVLMNIPYAAFYEAEGTADVDAVSSATKQKTLNSGLAGGSYHVNADGSDISGVTYPVYVADMSALTEYTKVEDSDELFGAGDYAYYILSETPAVYKTLNADGSFSAVNVEAAVVEGVVGTVAYLGRHTNLEIKLSGTDGIAQGDDVSGVIVTDSDGKVYGMRHVYNIWRATELGWNDDEYDLYGKTITNIRYYTQSGVIDYPVNIVIKPQSGAEITAEFTDANTVVLTGVPADFENPVVTVSENVRKGGAVIASGVTIAEDGVVTTTSPAVSGKEYKITIACDNYADVAVIARAPAGDVNGDGERNALDAAAVLRYVVGLQPEAFNSDAADMDLDTHVTPNDAALLLALSK